MGLFEVLARCSLSFPEERGGVHPHHRHSEIDEEQQLAGHRHQHVGVAVVQVPLVLEEGRPHPLPTGGTGHVRSPGEGIPASIREDRSKGRCIPVGDGAVVEHEVTAGVARIAGLGSLGPGVIVGGVVGNEVEHHPYPARPQCRDGGPQVVDRPERRQGGPVVRDCISAIATPGRPEVGRHDVQVGHTERAQMGNRLGKPVERVTESVHIPHRPDRVRPGRPLGVGGPIGGDQRFVPVQVAVGRHHHQTFQPPGKIVAPTV